MVYTQSRVQMLASFDLLAVTDLKVTGLIQRLENTLAPHSTEQFIAMHLDRYVRIHIVYINHSMSIICMNST